MLFLSSSGLGGLWNFSQQLLESQGSLFGFPVEECGLKFQLLSQQANCRRSNLHQVCAGGFVTQLGLIKLSCLWCGEQQMQQPIKDLLCLCDLFSFLGQRGSYLCSNFLWDYSFSHKSNIHLVYHKYHCFNQSPQSILSMV